MHRATRGLGVNTMKSLFVCCFLALQLLDSVGALQRILGGTSKDEISFANLDGQKRTIQNYAYAFSTFGVVILVGLVVQLCYLISAKNDTQKKIYAEISSKKRGQQEGHAPFAAVGPESSQNYNEVAIGSESKHDETKRQSEDREGNPARDGGRVEMMQRTSQSPKRKLILTSSGQLKAHAQQSRSEDSNPSVSVPNREQLPPIAPPPDAGDRPKRKLKMRMNEKGLTHITKN